MKLVTFLIVLIDLAGLLIISALIATAFYFLSIPFLPAFILSFAGLCVLGLLSNAIIKSKNEILSKRIDYETAKMLSSQTLTMPCAYCRASNSMYITTDKDMEFDCVSCKQRNKVILQFGAVRVTTPLNVSMPSEDLIPDSQLDRE